MLVSMDYATSGNKNGAGADVLTFVQLLGYSAKSEAIDAQSAWEGFGHLVIRYW